MVTNTEYWCSAIKRTVEQYNKSPKDLIYIYEL